MRFILLSTFCLSVGLAMVLSAGCKQLDLENSLEKIGFEEGPKVPDRLVCVWVDDVRYKPGKPAMRGFGGRIMFYAKKEEKPVKVDGSISIYVFDDQNDNPAESIPLKEFRTSQEVLPLHYSKSDIGHSYSFFLDWDEVGGPQKILTLIVRFKDSTGKVVVSDAARQTLTGVQRTDAGAIINKTTKRLTVQDLTQNTCQTTQDHQPLSCNQQACNQTTTSAVVPASYLETSPNEPVLQQKSNPRTTIITDTIDLPPSFTRKLINDTAQESTPTESAQPARNAVGSWDTSVSYQRPTSFAQRTGTASPAVSTEIQNLGKLDASRFNGANVYESGDEENAASTTTDVSTTPRFGQSSNRFLSPRHQALRERLRRPNDELAPSQPAP